MYERGGKFEVKVISDETALLLQLQAELAELRRQVTSTVSQFERLLADHYDR